MTNKGIAGCGCLVFVLVVIMVLTGVLMHPFTLRLIGNQFRYEDKIFSSDAIFVPRFQDDKNGELYIEAFREYSAGNGKAIFVEDDRILGISIIEFIDKMASARNVKKDAIVKMEASDEGLTRADKIKERFARRGFKKVIVLVPEYASRRFHWLYDSSQDGKTVYLVKPVSLSYFKRDRWWKDSGSRSLLAGEVYAMAAYYLRRFKYGEKEKENTGKR